MEDVSKQLANLETRVSELKSEVIVIRVAISQTATKIDLSKLDVSMVVWNAAMILASGVLAFIFAKTVH